MFLGVIELNAGYPLNTGLSGVFIFMKTPKGGRKGANYIIFNSFSFAFTLAFLFFVTCR